MTADASSPEISNMEIVKEARPDDWHEFASSWNWDMDVEPLYWIAEQPLCDYATALLIFMRAAADYHLDPANAANPSDRATRERLERIGRRLSGSHYRHHAFLLNKQDYEDAKFFVPRINNFDIEGISIPLDRLNAEGKKRHDPTLRYDDGAISSMRGLRDALKGLW